jgi:diguanylate cyclase (GGDEF)-like protein/PAS domain S-box-containing protein
VTPIADNGISAAWIKGFSETDDMNPIYRTSGYFELKLVRFFLAWLLFLSGVTGIALARDTKSIFVLHSYSQEYPWTRGQHAGFMAALGEDASRGYDVRVEYLDTKRTGYTLAHADMMAAQLRDKYRDYHPAAVYVTDDNALSFSLSHLDGIFPGVPVFFSGVNDYGVRTRIDPNRVTGVFEKKEIAPNLALMRMIAPNVRDILVVGDTTETYRAIEAELRAELQSRRDIRATYLSTNRNNDLVSQLRGRKERFIFLTTLGGMKDTQGGYMTLAETIDAIVKAGDFVVFSMEDAYLYPGVLGGFVTSGPSQGRVAAGLLRRYLDGTPLTALSPVETSPSEYVIDDRELERTRLILPAEIDAKANLLNPRTSFYEANRALVLGTLYVLLALLVAGLLVALVGFARKNRLILATTARLKESEAHFRTLFEQSPDASWILRDNRVVDSNQAAATLFGYPDTQAFLDTHPSGFSPELLPDGERSFDKTDRMVALAIEHGVHRFEWVHRRADGSTFDAEVTLAYMVLEGMPSIYGVVRDITARKQAEQALLQREASLAQAQQIAQLGSWELDLTCNELSWSDEVFRIFEIDPERFGASYEAFVKAIHPDDRERVGQAYADHVRERSPYDIEHRLQMPDGRVKYVIERCETIYDVNGGPLRSSGTVQDVTDRKHSQDQIEHLAYHDQLTGLPNRRLFLDRLGQALVASRRSKRFGALMFVDLDQFKQINDVHGHAIGDKVIQDVANRLRYFLRQGDTVARFGGDEFVILLPELSDDQETAATLALTVAEKIRGAMEQTTRIDEQDYRSTASIGITLFPKRDESVDDLVREADIAMYRAKDSGRNTYTFFEQDMQAHIAERYELERDLRDAVKNGELRLFLQSQVDASGDVCGAEALVRWQHPQRGLVQPATFIPLAEETGLIAGIGEWVLREACAQLARLNAAGSRLRLAVNVSPRQFHQANFVARVREILSETGADPLYLTLEITENLLVSQTAEVVSRMLSLSELGVRFAIDDFGTGYSSLAYLKRLPLNELKIDKSFVMDIPKDSNDVALVETILSMARHLGFEVVAEGVETKTQHEFLSGLGCERFQGYFFHRPELSVDWLNRMMGIAI